MSSAGARAANRLVRLVQSGPLEIRMLTQRVRSGTGRRPPGCPAKTFKMVTFPSGLIQFEVRSVPRRGPEHEAQSFYGRTDHRNFEGARGRGVGRRSLPRAW